jgi:protein involved in sex pheromone biosynthesis
MKKFSINDEVYRAGQFGNKIALFVWKINHEDDGSTTYNCSETKGRNEEVYNEKQIYYLTELYQI